MARARSSPRRTLFFAAAILLLLALLPSRWTRVVTSYAAEPARIALAPPSRVFTIVADFLRPPRSAGYSDDPAVREIEQNWAGVLVEQLLPVIYDLGIYRDLANYFINDLKMDWAPEGTARFEKRKIGTSRQAASLDEIAQSKELEGLVASAITYNTTANLESGALRKRIEEILALLEEEIQE